MLPPQVNQAKHITKEIHYKNLLVKLRLENFKTVYLPTVTATGIFQVQKLQYETNH